MRLLLDTNAWIWMTSDPSRFSAHTRALMEDPKNEIHLSVASTWEMGIKVGLGKLQLPEPLLSYQQTRMERHGVRSLAIEHAHAALAGGLPPLHRDPFDRLLVAQSSILGMTLVTSDSFLSGYGVAILPA